VGATQQHNARSVLGLRRREPGTTKKNDALHFLEYGPDIQVTILMNNQAPGVPLL
jgi:hypothetical protein